MSLLDRQSASAREQLRTLAAARANRPLNRGTGPEVLDPAAADRIAALERSILRSNAQSNRDKFERLDEAALVAKEDLGRQLLISPPDRELLDEGISILDNPNSPVESVLNRADSPTAVWEYSGWREREIREWGFAWQFAHRNSSVPTANWFQSRSRSKVHAEHAAYLANPQLWVSDILFGTRIVRYHTGVHYDDCPSDCTEAHGMIDVGGSSVVENHFDRYEASDASDAASASEFAEHLDAPFTTSIAPSDRLVYTNLVRSEFAPSASRSVRLG